MSAPGTEAIEGIVTLTTGELVIVGVLVLSLAANVLQLYQARTRRVILVHGLAGLFNAIAWLQARDLETLRQLRGRALSCAGSEARLAMQEFAGHLHQAHYTLRLLHEQLVAIAKSVNDSDPRWTGDRFGYADEQLEAFQARARGWGRG
jgi:hypothetical protein